MKKALERALFVVIVTLTAWISLPKQLTQPARAVEVQPGTNTRPESSRLSEGPKAIVGDTWEPVAATQPYSEVKLPGLEDFIQQVMDGQTGSVRGLYIPGVLALRVVQQPDGQYDFISYEEDTATQFQSPNLFGVIGLLAHNFLSGRLFFAILPGQILTIIYGDGQTENFRVAEIHDYQRLTELDLHSDFFDLENNQTLTADQVFQLYYQGDRHLTLQTCLEKDGNWNWGIRMITAFPVISNP